MKITAIDVPAEIERLKALPYTHELVRNSDGTWLAGIVEFAGCLTEGATKAEALAMLDDAMTEWLSVKLEDGDAIPAPFVQGVFSGKFLVRTTRSLHRDLTRCAQRENVSLNQYVVTKLAASCEH